MNETIYKSSVQAESNSSLSALTKPKSVLSSKKYYMYKHRFYRPLLWKLKKLHKINAYDLSSVDSKTSSTSLVASVPLQNRKYSPMSKTKQLFLNNRSRYTTLVLRSLQRPSTFTRRKTKQKDIATSCSGVNESKKKRKKPQPCKCNLPPCMQSPRPCTPQKRKQKKKAKPKKCKKPKNNNCTCKESQSQMSQVCLSDKLSECLLDFIAKSQKLACTCSSKQQKSEPTPAACTTPPCAPPPPCQGNSPCQPACKPPAPCCCKVTNDTFNQSTSEIRCTGVSSVYDEIVKHSKCPCTPPLKEPEIKDSSTSYNIKFLPVIQTGKGNCLPLLDSAVFYSNSTPPPFLLENSMKSQSLCNCTCTSSVDCKCKIELPQNWYEQANLLEDSPSPLLLDFGIPIQGNNKQQTYKCENSLRI